MTKGLTKLVADGENFFVIKNCAREEAGVKPIGRAITIKKNRFDRELQPKIMKRAPVMADAYTISPMTKTTGSTQAVYAVQYYRVVWPIDYADR